jgi:hypothetical protein
LIATFSLSNRLPKKFAENLQFIFKQFPCHDSHRFALANLIFRDSMPLQEVKKLTGASNSAMSWRNPQPKKHLFSIVFSKVGYL